MLKSLQFLWRAGTYKWNPWIPAGHMCCSDLIRNLEPVSISRYRLTSIGTPMLKIRRSRDRFIFNMGIPIHRVTHSSLLDAIYSRDIPGDIYILAPPVLKMKMMASTEQIAETYSIVWYHLRWQHDSTNWETFHTDLLCAEKELGLRSSVMPRLHLSLFL